jgi:hypothetical protein
LLFTGCQGRRPDRALNVSIGKKKAVLEPKANFFGKK